jgi:hypothetical protein
MVKKLKVGGIDDETHRNLARYGAQPQLCRVAQSRVTPSTLPSWNFPLDTSSLLNLLCRPAHRLTGLHFTSPTLSRQLIVSDGDGKTTANANPASPLSHPAIAPPIGYIYGYLQCPLPSSKPPPLSQITSACKLKFRLISHEQRQL